MFLKLNEDRKIKNSHIFKIFKLSSPCQIDNQVQFVLKEKSLQKKF